MQLCLDSSGLYVATSCTDKTLAVYDYYSGECMATMYGHSELVTGLRFTNDGKHLVSVSGDGCVFIWKLPHDMTVTVQARLTQQSARAAKESRRATYNAHGGSGSGGPLSPDLKTDNEEFGSPPPELFDPNANANQQGMEEDYRFSVGQLPLWAKKQIGENNPPKPGSNSTNKGGVDLPKGRWAQRMDTTNASGITVKSFYQGDSVIPFPPSQSKFAASLRVDLIISDVTMAKLIRIRLCAQWRKETWQTPTVPRTAHWRVTSSAATAATTGHFSKR